MSPRRAFCLFVSTVLAISAIATAASVATAGRSAITASDNPTVGRDLYRKYCGQCHALREARAVGFGSNKKKTGFGVHGGPSFNELRVPYTMSVRHVTQPTGGHEIVRHKISTKQLHTVAAYVAKVTRDHPIPALPTDG